MRDPRPGFAKSFRNCHRIAALSSLGVSGLAWVLCCACGGATGQRAPAAVAPSLTPSPNVVAPAPTARTRGIALSYVAPDACPDLAGYARHVRTRSVSLNFLPRGAEAAQAAVDVRIEPALDAGGWVGRVTIGGSPALEREVRSERCEDVVEALALITVLRLEGAANLTAGSAAANPSGVAARSEPGAPGEATAENPSAAPAPSEADTSGEAAARAVAPAEPSAPPPSPTRASVPLVAPTTSAVAAAPSELDASGEHPANESREAESSPESTVPTQAQRVERASSNTARPDDSEADPSARDSNEPARATAAWQWPTIDVGVAAQAGYASVPGHAFKALLQGELRFGDSMSSWATNLSLAYTRGASDAPSAEVDILLLSAELGLCPPAIIDHPSVWFRACAGARAGSVRVLITPEDPAESPADVWRPWLAVAPALQLGVPLSQHWALRGAFDVAILLVRDRFDVTLPERLTGLEERITLYRPPATSFEFGLALSHTF